MIKGTWTWGTRVAPYPGLLVRNKEQWADRRVMIANTRVRGQRSVSRSSFIRQGTILKHKSAFETCAALGNHNYIQECCQGSCTYGYDDCYFCPAFGTGGPHCFKLEASKETACLASSNCADSPSPSAPSPSPSSDTRYAAEIGLFLDLF